MDMTRKTIVVTLIALGCAVSVNAQSVKRHPGDVLNYQVKLEGGDVAKVQGGSLYFYTPDSPAPNQPGLRSDFRGNCTKSSAAVGILDCSATIPINVISGNYRLEAVDVVAGQFSKEYTRTVFQVPLIPIENPAMFTPPNKITVTEKP
jgi:hypothetical protein